MDRYEVWHGTIKDRENISALTTLEACNLLNSLTRELAAANAKIEKAPHGPFCSYKMQAHIAPCDCWKSED